MNYLTAAIFTIKNTSWYTIGKWSAITSFVYGFYKLGYADKEEVKEYSFYRGLQISQKFKSVKAWDKYVEPMIIHRFGVMFGAGHSFLEGLISDNEDENIKMTLKKIDDEYNKDINEYYSCKE